MQGYVHGVDSSVDNLDDLVEDDKGSLQTGKLDKSLNSSGISLPTSLNLLASLAQTSKAEIAGAFCLERFELGKENTADVLLLGSQA